MTYENEINNLKTTLSNIQQILKSRKNKNWLNDPFAVTLEEILCSLSIEQKKNKNSFELIYVCNGDPVFASYPYDTKHVLHCLFELLSYLELHETADVSLPVSHKLCNLKRQFKALYKKISKSKQKL